MLICFLMIRAFGCSKNGQVHFVLLIHFMAQKHYLDGVVMRNEAKLTYDGINLSSQIAQQIFQVPQKPPH